MDHARAAITARIRLLPTKEGGKTWAVRGHWLPNHNFFGPENRETVIGIVHLPDGVEVHPGESVEARVQFAAHPGLLEMLQPGREWRLQEGTRLVGAGRVLTVLPEG